MQRTSVPSRASISLLDSNTFGPGEPGGGNLGFAIDVMTALRLGQAARSKLDIIECLHQDLNLLVQETLDRWRFVTGIRSRYTVDLVPTGQISNPRLEC